MSDKWDSSDGSTKGSGSHGEEIGKGQGVPPPSPQLTESQPTRDEGSSHSTQTGTESTPPNTGADS